ncbi:MAG TPA: GNAT family N-acetyltransferase [Gemmatimonadaceae bacterium]|nr:GNAT family N-acetyltransferase [Gemmatimonadaceae bacterium]
MNIRRARPEDLAALIPLFDAYRQFYDQPGDATRAEVFLRERIEKGESVIFVAEDGATLVGFVQLYPSFWSVAACRAWILNDLYVHPAHRGSGVGRALLERSRVHAEETGAGGLSLATQRTNLTARRLYESLHWQRDDEFVHYELTVP